MPPLCLLPLATQPQARMHVDVHPSARQTWADTGRSFLEVSPAILAAVITRQLQGRCLEGDQGCGPHDRPAGHEHRSQTRRSARGGQAGSACPRWWGRSAAGSRPRGRVEQFLLCHRSAAPLRPRPDWSRWHEPPARSPTADRWPVLDAPPQVLTELAAQQIAWSWPLPSPHVGPAWSTATNGSAPPVGPVGGHTRSRAVRNAGKTRAHGRCERIQPPQQRQHHPPPIVSCHTVQPQPQRGCMSKVCAPTTPKPCGISITQFHVCGAQPARPHRHLLRCPRAQQAGEQGVAGGGGGPVSGRGLEQGRPGRVEVCSGQVRAAQAYAAAWYDEWPDHADDLTGEHPQMGASLLAHDLVGEVAARLVVAAPGRRRRAKRRLHRPVPARRARRRRPGRCRERAPGVAGGRARYRRRSAPAPLAATTTPRRAFTVAAAPGRRLVDQGAAVDEHLER